jgi:hypothetical protein
MRLLLATLARTFGILGILLMVADAALETQYARTRPRVAEPQFGFTSPLNVHGIVYVTGRELFHLHVLLTSAAICGAIFAVAVSLEIRRRKLGWGLEKNLGNPL